MMNATKKIENLMGAENEALLTVCLSLVTKYGSVEDAAYLLTLFLQTKDERLLKPLQVCGNEAIGETLYQHAIENNQLKENFPPEILLALGYLQHPETEGILMDYYQTIFDKKLDWHLHQAVCLSLSNYACKGFETIIRQKIQKCFALSLFPEMIPVLAYKTGDVSLAEKLYEHGCTKASSDSNAGLLLGIALFGTDQKGLFKKAIYNPDWEAGSTATGNRTYTMMGLSCLKVPLEEMFNDIKQLHEAGGNHLPQHLFLLESMLEAKLAGSGAYLLRSIPVHAETYKAVYEALFAPADGATIFTFIEQVQVTVWKDLLVQSFERLQELYALQMGTEAELDYLKMENVSKGF